MEAKCEHNQIKSFCYTCSLSDRVKKIGNHMEENKLLHEKLQFLENIKRDIKDAINESIINSTLENIYTKAYRHGFADGFNLGRD